MVRKYFTGFLGRDFRVRSSRIRIIIFLELFILAACLEESEFGSTPEIAYLRGKRKDLGSVLGGRETQLAEVVAPEDKYLVLDFFNKYLLVLNIMWFHPTDILVIFLLVSSESC